MLDEFVRPYQNVVCDVGRIDGLAFVNGRSVLFVGEAEGRRHFMDRSLNIYSDKISKYGVRCNEQSGGAVVRRLQRMYDRIYVDEVQDLAAWDLDILELLFESLIDVELVGDYRQSTYRTNDAAKYRQYAGQNIIRRFREWEAAGVVTLEGMNHSYRCSQGICDFADRIFVDANSTESRNTIDTGHNGVFVVSPGLVAEYYSRFSPVVLRYDRRHACDGYPARNMKATKGLTFDRVLIYPHGPLRRLIATGNFTQLNDPATLYVAATRARYSVAFVYEGQCEVDGVREYSL